ncbi:DUF4238 domain-containing protein [Amycolatopsis sp. NPDC006125]|uniref:DUF4238 domain-containing protein n=1 Tax=Amycolatopsis sp. NPDC006125 TaxID=3156730 RepID=UPI0033A37D0B
MTNDHTVPRMYLRRFGWTRKPGSKQWFVRARRVDTLDRTFEPNVAKIAAVTDFYGPKVEKLLCLIEKEATPAFDAMLEDPRSALPLSWPLPEELRFWMAWWVAAQIVRTTRQRRRLEHLTSNNTATEMEIPGRIKSLAGRDVHVQFITDQLATLSAIIYQRPWGLGFSDVCLMTSDVPVVILNGHDDENQLLAASYWSIILPLDPHRFLFLPDAHACDEDPRKRVDHLVKFDGAIGIALNEVLYAAADERVFCHQEHDPVEQWRFEGPRLKTPWRPDDSTSNPEFMFQYPALAPRIGIERRWLTEHPRPRSAQAGDANPPEA